MARVPQVRSGHLGVSPLAALSAVILAALAAPARADIAATGFQNRYYPAAGYRGSRVLEHNQTGRFSVYLEVLWSQSIVVDSLQRLWVVDKTYHQVVLVQDGLFTEYAGQRSTPGYADGTRRQALFNSPAGIAIFESSDGNLLMYISDTNNHCIRLIDYSIGRTTTVVGSAGLDGLRDGPGDMARLRFPATMGIDSAGENLFVLDNYRRIRHVDLSTTIPMVATLVDGACRSVSRQTVAITAVLRTVGCHPDWRALDVGDSEVDLYVAEATCVGHMATCGPRNFPPLPDSLSQFLRLPPTATA